MQICFATNNQHKLREVKLMLGNRFEILSLEDIGCQIDLPESKLTLEGNSEEKAQFIANNYKLNCFADDTGLEVDALNGSPGVISARYAGPQRNNMDNIKLLLNNLMGSSNRSARFRTVITLILNQKTMQFEGIVNGIISESLRGQEGFGYDPVFIPDGYNKTFAEFSVNQKNKISHRGIAFHKLVNYLQKNIF